MPLEHSGGFPVGYMGGVVCQSGCKVYVLYSESVLVVLFKFSSGIWWFFIFFVFVKWWKVEVFEVSLGFFVGVCLGAFILKYVKKVGSKP